jgi:hypothetical protein
MPTTLNANHSGWWFCAPSSLAIDVLSVAALPETLTQFFVKSPQSSPM